MPVRSLKIIYLDLKDWIQLSQALSGHPEGDKHKETLAACRVAVEKRTVVFPISLYTCVEILKIKQYRQRLSLREVIEQISKYMVVTSRFVVATHEIEAVLDRIVGPNPRPINTMDYLDWGISRAMGKSGAIKIKTSSGVDVTAETRRSFADGPQAFDEILRNVEWDLNQWVIAGPTPGEEPEYREQGWNPAAVLDQYELQSNRELELVRQLDHKPEWRRHRLRDVVSAREVLFGLDTILWRALAERGVASLKQILPKTEDARDAFDSMPSFDVAVTLKMSCHRNAMHVWKQNDIHDINALASTIPYCDVVVTDREMASHVTRTGLPQRFNTVVLARLSDLPEYL